MATKSIPILGHATLPDTSGEVFFETYTVKATNDTWKHLVCVFNDTATKDGLYGTFRVPEDYVGTAKIMIDWATTATTGDVEWDFSYRAIGTGESYDQATTQEDVNSNDTAGASAHLRQEIKITLTAGNFAAGDRVEWVLSRDGTDAGDTIAAAVMLFGLDFEYADA